MKVMIKGGYAYADNSTAEAMKYQRDNGVESGCRSTPTAVSLQIFKDMLNGRAEGWCIRGKMDM